MDIIFLVGSSATALRLLSNYLFLGHKFVHLSQGDCTPSNIFSSIRTAQYILIDTVPDTLSSISNELLNVHITPDFDLAKYFFTEVLPVAPFNRVVFCCSRRPKWLTVEIPPEYQ